MLLAVGVHAALELIRLVGVAGLAVNRRNLVRVWIAGDVGVTGIAAQRAVNAGAELLAVDAYAVPLRILQGRVRVACQAFGLRMADRPTGNKNQTKQRSNNSAAKFLHLPSSFSRQREPRTLARDIAALAACLVYWLNDRVVRITKVLLCRSEGL